MSMPSITGYKGVKVPTKTKEQMDLYNRMQAGIGPGFEKGMARRSAIAGGDESAFAEMEAPAWRAMSQYMGNLGSRYSGMGSGARRSSGFGLEATAAGQQLAEQLASRRYELSERALSDLQGLSQDLLGEQLFTPHYVQKPWMQFANAFAGMAGDAASSYASGFGGWAGKRTWGG